MLDSSSSSGFPRLLSTPKTDGCLYPTYLKVLTPSCIGRVGKKRRECLRNGKERGVGEKRQERKERPNCSLILTINS